MKTNPLLNNQQLLFIQSLLNTKTEQTETIKVSVTERVDKIKYIIEVKPQNNNLLPFRILDKNSDPITLWNTWENESQIVNSFRMMSF